VAVACMAAVAGCGSRAEPPPAAEPATSPPPAERPAGRVVSVGANPEGIVADPASGTLAVALRNPDRLAVVDAASGRVVRRVRLPESGRHLALAGGVVLVPAERANALVRVPLRHRGPVSSTPVGRFPHDAASAAGRVLVSNEDAASVTIVRPRGARRTLPAPSGPGGVAAAGGPLVAVVGVRDRRVALYDVRRARKLGEASGGVGPTHAAAARGLLYVVDTDGDAILVYRLRPRFEFLDRQDLPGAPYGIAVDRRRGRLWVTTTARDEVVRFDLTEHAPRRVASYPTVRQPNSVAVDERTGRVFVASRSGSEIQILGR
jgi:DNA-binding beta-propeller fold protein YncE